MIQHNVPLKNYNTFGVEANAAHFCIIKSEADLTNCITEINQDYANLSPFLLGGGSNVLFTQPVPNLILHMALMGIDVIDNQNQHVIVEVGAGVNWHDLVLWSLEKHYYGLENLSLIPGSVGAAPVQNIGAYGVELKDCFDSLDAICLKTGKKQIFSNDDCQFAYRNSVFKTEYKNRYAITKVRFRLNKHFEPKLHYGALKNYLNDHQINQPTAYKVSQAVIAIRQSKLPDPKLIGNAGSFFKNPIISMAQFQALQTQCPDIVFFPMNETLVKIPAGWLIEHAGFKGKRLGDVGTYEKQALVIVNHGHATGQAIYDFALRIQQAVNAQFGIQLLLEVNIPLANEDARF